MTRTEAINYNKALPVALTSTGWTVETPEGVIIAVADVDAARAVAARYGFGIAL